MRSHDLQSVQRTHSWPQLYPLSVTDSAIAQANPSLQPRGCGNNWFLEEPPGSMREWPQAHVNWPGFHNIDTIYVYICNIDILYILYIYIYVCTYRLTASAPWDDERWCTSTPLSLKTQVLVNLDHLGRGVLRHPPLVGRIHGFWSPDAEKLWEMGWWENGIMMRYSWILTGFTFP